MAYTEAQRLMIRSQYVHKRKGLDQLAKLYQIPMRTLSRWKNEAKKDNDDWDIARTAYSISEKGSAAVSIAFLEDFMLLATNTMAEIKAKPDMPPKEKVATLTMLADAYSKAMATAKKHAPELNKISVALDVLHDLADFARDNFPQHAQALLELLEPFGEHVVKRY